MPIAAVSIGQVHAATLPGGEDVGVKVRRPGVIDQIAVDLDLLARVAAIAKRDGRGSAVDPVGLAGSSATRCAVGSTTHAKVTTPSSSRPSPEATLMCTCRRFSGITRPKGSSPKNASGDSRSTTSPRSTRRRYRPVTGARRFADAYLTMVFVHGFFHADRHPGNVFVESADGIGFVDFGMMGAVSVRTGRGWRDPPCGHWHRPRCRWPTGCSDSAWHPTTSTGRASSVTLLHSSRSTPVSRSNSCISPLPVAVGMQSCAIIVCDCRVISRSLLKTVMMCEGVAAYLDPGFRAGAAAHPVRHHVRR